MNVTPSNGIFSYWRLDVSETCGEEGGSFVQHEVKKIRNTHIQRILLGVPPEHKHLRALIELTDGTKLMFHEATLASLVRAFLTTKLDPIRDAVELVGTELAERRTGFAEYQLLEAGTSPEMVKKELGHALNQK